MTIGNKNLDGEISVTDFSISFGSAAVSADHQKVVINYTGYASPELIDVVLDSYEYSLDNDTTWETMTPSAGTDLTSLIFSEAGTAQTFEWEAKTDEGTSFYNTNLRVRINATSGSEETGVTSTSYYFVRLTTNTSVAGQQSPFPESYSGKSGTELIEGLAPRL